MYTFKYARYLDNMTYMEIVCLANASQTSQYSVEIKITYFSNTEMMQTQRYSIFLLRSLAVVVLHLTRPTRLGVRHFKFKRIDETGTGINLPS